MSEKLPIHDILPELLGCLREGSNAVLVAPPGAGKTTAVAPALLGEPWCTGEILLLSPRRLAARAAGERMASQAGESVGKTFGYATLRCGPICGWWPCRRHWTARASPG
jgi:ATP-dependent helicase HrpB